MQFLLRWGINTLSLILTGYIVKGIRVENFWAALMAALFLGLVNAFVRPILVFLTLPINIVSLGLFTFVINGFLLYFVAWAVPGFSIANIWWAILGAIILSIISLCLSLLIAS